MRRIPRVLCGGRDQCIFESSLGGIDDSYVLSRLVLLLNVTQIVVLYYLDIDINIYIISYHIVSYRIISYHISLHACTASNGVQKCTHAFDNSGCRQYTLTVHTDCTH